MSEQGEEHHHIAIPALIPVEGCKAAAPESTPNTTDTPNTSRSVAHSAAQSHRRAKQPKDMAGTQ